MTVLEGGYEFRPKNRTLAPDDVGIRGEIILQFLHSFKIFLRLRNEAFLKFLLLI